VPVPVDREVPNLRVTWIEVGLLLNFGPRPEFQRLIYSNSRKHGPGMQ
jgi:hypothetical protein